jgi:hypothetical protein
MIEHPVEPRATTAMLPPVMSKVVDPDPLCWLEFTEDAILTSCKSGMFCLTSDLSISSNMVQGISGLGIVLKMLPLTRAT